MNNLNQTVVRVVRSRRFTHHAAIPSRRRAASLPVAATLALIAAACACSSDKPNALKQSAQPQTAEWMDIPKYRTFEPQIASESELLPPSNDTNGNRIDDTLEAASAKVRATLSNPKATEAQKRAALREKLILIVDSREEPTREQLGQLLTRDCTLLRVFQTIARGFTATCPGFTDLVQLVAAIDGNGPRVLAVQDGSKEVHALLHMMTRSGRARVNWQLGYQGSANTTVAIIDTGITSDGTGEGTAKDFAGRIQYWHDWTAAHHLNPWDGNAHGSHVSGIAAGTGRQSGVNPGVLIYTQQIAFPATPFGRAFFATWELPPLSGGTGPTAFSWSSNIVWGPINPDQMPVIGATLMAYQNEMGEGVVPPGDVQKFPLVQMGDQFPDFPTDSTGRVYLSSDPSWPDGIGLPLRRTNVTFHHADGTTSFGHPNDTSVFQVALFSIGGTGWGTDAAPLRDGAAASRIVARNGHRFDLGDTFPFSRGVAPGCRLAGFKVLGDNGSGTQADLENALDDVATQAQANNIKVANMSLGFTGPVPSVRTKTNNVVNAGVFMAVAGGNSGPQTATMGDPARACKAMTVASSSSWDRVAIYSSVGFTNGSLPSEDRIKPDITAPGGDAYYGEVLSVSSNDTNGGTLPVQVLDTYNVEQGTSMASPFLAGSAALVIDAWEQSGHAWAFGSDHDPLLAKMLLAATATETNTIREEDARAPVNVNNPPLGRAVSPKDEDEGYGMVNTDAAIECLTIALPSSGGSGTLGGFSALPQVNGDRFAKRASCFRVSHNAGTPVTYDLTVPETGDFDLYLYDSTWDTGDPCGNPVILASSTDPDLGAPEHIAYTPVASGTAYLVVKKVSGYGLFRLNGSGGSAPTVATVTPHTGPIAGGNTVTITGSNFSAGNTFRVVFGGVKAESFAVTNSTTLTAVVPANGPGPADVTVLNSDGQFATKREGYAYSGTAPMLELIAPNHDSAFGGALLTVTGADFASGATLTLGGTAALSTSVRGTMTILAIAPAHPPGVVDVVVTNADGQSITLPHGFTFLAQSPPTVTHASPNTGSTAGGLSIMVTGTNFVTTGTTQVSFGGVPGTNVHVASTTSLTVTTPAHTAGAVDIAVVGPDLQTGTLTGGFTYVSPQPPPIVTGASPDQDLIAGGTVVTLSGANFFSGSGLAVKFGTSAATNVTVVNASSVRATSPAHAAGTVDITLTNPDGQSGTKASAFTYVPVPGPSISGISPTSGMATGDMSVTIIGTNFRSGNIQVRLGGSDATAISFVSSTTLTARTPVHPEGAVDVMVVNPDGQAGTLGSAFTYNSAQALSASSGGCGYSSTSESALSWLALVALAGWFLSRRRQPQLHQ